MTERNTSGYQVETLFEYPEVVKKVYETLNPPQQSVFDIFWQSFILSSGDVPTQVSILAQLGTYLDQSTKDEVAAHESPPSYILAIRAPKKHAGLGKPTKNPEVNQEIDTQIAEIWGAFHSAVTNTSTQDAQIKENAILDFMLRDSTFAGENTKYLRKRVTGNQLNVSYFREFALEENAEKFSPPVQQFLREVKEFCLPYFTFRSVATIDLGSINEVYSWREKMNETESDLGAAVDIHLVKPSLAADFETHFGREISFNDLIILEALFSLESGWKQRNPTQDFFKS